MMEKTTVTEMFLDLVTTVSMKSPLTELNSWPLGVDHASGSETKKQGGAGGSGADSLRRSDTSVKVRFLPWRKPNGKNATNFESSRKLSEKREKSRRNEGWLRSANEGLSKILLRLSDASRRGECMSMHLDGATPTRTDHLRPS